MWCVSYICGWCYRHVAPLWETVQFPGVVSHHCGSGVCGVCPIYVVDVTDMSLPSERQFSSLELSAIIVVAVCVVCVLHMCGWCYRHVAPLWWETVQFRGVVSHHCGSGLCGVCPIYVVGITDMSLPSERQFSSLELSAIIVVAVCVVCVLYMWLVLHLQTCRSPLSRQFSSLELSAIIVVAVCVVCVLYMWLVLQTCRSPLRDSSVPWSCRPSSW